MMVTHELDIAAYCKRIIVMRDGELITDTRNTDRRFAEKELASLDRVQRNAQIA